MSSDHPWDFPSLILQFEQQNQRVSLEFIFNGFEGLVHNSSYFIGSAEFLPILSPASYVIKSLKLIIRFCLLLFQQAQNIRPSDGIRSKATASNFGLN